MVKLWQLFTAFPLLAFWSLFPEHSLSAQTVPVIPQPQQVTWFEGSFPFRGVPALRCYYPERSDTLAFNQIGREMATLGFEIRRSDPAQANFFFGLLPEINNFPRLGRTVEVMLKHPIGREGYHLVITPQYILILAETNAGLFYGAQTFRQLLRAYGRSGQLPCMSITDYPQFGFRGVMDDINRGPLPNMAFMKEQIRRFSELKFNYLNFSLEHVVRLPGHESLAPEDGITPEQWQELAEYAGRRNVHLIGGFQSLGHARNILSHPDYRRLGLTDRMFRPADREVQDFLTDVYAKMLPFFNSSYFNINCDEAFDLEKVRDISPERAYIKHVQPLLSYLISRGKRPMIWGDMLLQSPDLLDELPKGTVVLPWNYDAGVDYAAMLEPLRERDIDFIVCPGILNSNRLLPDFDTALDNIRGLVATADSMGALGVMATVWDDGGHAFFSHDWYGIAYAGAQSWHPGGTLSRDDFDRPFSRSLMGDPFLLLPRIVRTLNGLKDLPPTQDMADRVLHQRLIPDPGEPLNVDTSGWAAVRDTAAEALRLAAMLGRTASEGSRAEADLPYWTFIAKLYAALADARFQQFEMKRNYQEAAARFQESPDSTEKLLNAVLKDCLALNDQWDDLESTLKTLWLKENRTYWLEEVSRTYSERKQRLRRMLGSTLVLGSLKDKTDGANWSPPEDLGLGVSPLNYPHLDYWLLAGPAPLRASGILAPDFLVSRGATPGPPPSPTAYYRLPNGQELPWEKHQAPLADWVNLKEHFTVDSNVVAYAYCQLESDENKNLETVLSYDGGITVWLNGNIVFEDEGRENPSGRERSCILPLQSGLNHLLLQLTGGAYPWRFSFGLPATALRNRKFRYALQGGN